MVTRRLLGALALALALIVGGRMVQGDGPMLRVTSAQFGEDWPLVVPSGSLSCYAHGRITFQWKGTEYGLTGGPHSAYAAIAAIRAPGRDLAPLIDHGRTLCQ